MAATFWFKIWHDARTDRKLAALTDAEFRVWFQLLCLASESDERGTIDMSDGDLVAIECGVTDSSEMWSCIERMGRLRLVQIDGNKVTFPAWGSRQNYKPSDLPENTRKRKQEQRARESQASDQRKEECHAPVTPLSRLDVTQVEEKRGEESRREPSPPYPQGGTMAADFEAYWDAHPKPWDRQRTIIAFVKAIENGATSTDLIASAKSYAKRVRREGTDRKHVSGSAPFIIRDIWRECVPKPSPGPCKACGDEGGHYDEAADVWVKCKECGGR